MEELHTEDLKLITDQLEIKNPTLQMMHREADNIQRFMDQRADLMDPCALTERLKEMDAYMARLTDMQIKAKSMKKYAETSFNRSNGEALSKMSATNSNRIINAYIFEFAITYDRMEAMYKALSSMSDHLVTQISYIKTQMNMR